LIAGLPQEPSPLSSGMAGTISYTAFCEADHVLSTVVSSSVVPPVGCRACASGLRSLGGVAHECDNCTGAACLPQSRSIINTTIDASGAGVVTGDVLVLRMQPLLRSGRSTPEELLSEEGAVPEKLIDLSPPVLFNVSDAPVCNFTLVNCSDSREADVDVILAGELVQAWWGTAQDHQSVIVGYTACLGSAPLLCDIEPHTAQLLTEPAHQFLLSTPLAHNQRVCTTVLAQNEVGLVSSPVASDCAVADATPPICHFVGMGLSIGQHQRDISSRNVVFANVVAFDELAALESVEWCLSTIGGACDVAPTTTSPMHRFDGTLPGVPADVVPYVAELGVGSLNLPFGSNVSITARVVSAVNLTSLECTSDAAQVGSAVLHFHEAQMNTYVAELDIPDYEAVSQNENATNFGNTSSHVMFFFTAPSNGTVAYERLNVATSGSSRRLQTGVHGSATMTHANQFVSTYSSQVTGLPEGQLVWDGRVRWQTRYNVQEILLQSNSHALALAESQRTRLLPDLWVVNWTTNEWVRARETCTSRYWQHDLSRGNYEVDVCDFSPGRPATNLAELRLFFAVGPLAQARWSLAINSTSGPRVAARGETATIYRTRSSTYLQLPLNGTDSQGVGELSYYWGQTATSNSPVSFVSRRSADAIVAFDASTVPIGTHNVNLTVSDSAAESDTTSVTLVVAECASDQFSPDAFICAPVPSPAQPPSEPPAQPTPAAPDSPPPPPLPPPPSPLPSPHVPGYTVPPTNPPLPPAVPPPSWCFEQCPYASDGVCDDGGPGAVTGSCRLGYDCTDCGLRTILPPSPPPPPEPVQPPPPPPLTPTWCTNTCPTASDGWCDDGGTFLSGGSQSVFNSCALGTDCIDCGPRNMFPPEPPPEPPQPPPLPPASPPSSPSPSLPPAPPPVSPLSPPSPPLPPHMPPTKPPPLPPCVPPPLPPSTPLPPLSPPPHPATPSYAPPSLPLRSSREQTAAGLSVGAIAGLSIGVSLAVIGLVAYALRRRMCQLKDALLVEGTPSDSYAHTGASLEIGPAQTRERAHSSMTFVPSVGWMKPAQAKKLGKKGHKGSRAQAEAHARATMMQGTEQANLVTTAL